MMEKELMAEAAILYYEKKMTQQEIADVLYLSRQTVSKLLNEAIQQNIVEIKVHNPKRYCENLAENIKKVYGIREAVVISSGSQNNSIRLMHTVKAAADYLSSVFAEGNHNIAVSWGRTVQMLISEIQELNTAGNTVYPLFGATDQETSYFSSNEIARSLADKINATVKYAWFPYLADNETDRRLFTHTSYYKSMCKLWDNIDIAVVGIGNNEIVDLFRQTFGHNDKYSAVIGDVATHFFTDNGQVIDLYKNTIRASTDNLKKAKTTVAIACGSDKTKAIDGALKTGLINVYITDEYTAAELLK